MKIHKKTIEKESRTQIDFIDITHDVEDAVEESKVQNGQVLIFSPHATAGIVINENESLLLQDFQRMLYRLVPVDERYSHDLFELKRTVRSDGRSNGHSHCKNLITSSNETVPIEAGKMLLGSHQNVFFVDFDGARKRDIIIQVTGE